MIDAAAALADLLDGTPGLDLGDNLFLGLRRSADPDLPAASVFLQNTGGGPPTPYFGGGSLYAGGVQALVRGNPDATAAAEALARAVLERLHTAIPTGCVGVWAQQSAPYFLGLDSRNCSTWSINFTVRWAA